MCKQQRPIMKRSSKETGSKVSFSDLTETVVVQSPPTRSETKNANWYSKEDITKFRSLTPEDCLLSPGNSKLRKQRIQSLLSVQSEHRELGIQDPKGLRQISRAMSKQSLKDAIQRAEAEVGLSLD